MPQASTALSWTVRLTRYLPASMQQYLCRHSVRAVRGDEQHVQAPRAVTDAGVCNSMRGVSSAPSLQVISMQVCPDNHLTVIAQARLSGL